METNFERNSNVNSLQQFEALFHHATIGIIISNKLGEIINANDMACKFFDYQIDELVGQKIEILLPEKYQHSHQHNRESFYSNPHNRAMGANRDLNARKKDGSTFPVEISLSYYKIKEELFAIAFIIDISERKANEEFMLAQKNELEKKTIEISSMNIGLENKIEDRTKMLRETLQELENSRQELSEAFDKEKELSDLKSRFVTMASHEFRTPLSTILSSASLLNKYTKTEEQEKRDRHIMRIKDAVGSMKNILEDFLSLGKLEDGLVTARYENLEVQDCVHAIKILIEDIQQICKPGQKLIFTHVGEGNLVTDLNMIKNILVNLISNAIKFSSENSVINIDCILDGAVIKIVVKDNGIGISEEDQEHLFERFFRAKNASNIQGTGLGLHIVSKYLELMNGKISLKSILNEGTTFTLEIPNINS